MIQGLWFNNWVIKYLSSIFVASYSENQLIIKQIQIKWLKKQ
jgi:hypothetical protein